MTHSERLKLHEAVRFICALTGIPPARHNVLMKFIALLTNSHRIDKLKRYKRRVDERMM